MKIVDYGVYYNSDKFIIVLGIFVYFLLHFIVQYIVSYKLCGKYSSKLSVIKQILITIILIILTSAFWTIVFFSIFRPCLTIYYTNNKFESITKNKNDIIDDIVNDKVFYDINSNYGKVYEHSFNLTKEEYEKTKSYYEGENMKFLLKNKMSLMNLNQN